jgi:hypothetical protein
MECLPGHTDIRVYSGLRDTTNGVYPEFSVIHKVMYAM